MGNNNKICVIVPAYNEELLLPKVLEGMPDFVSKVIVINDCSIDGTKDVISHFEKLDSRVASIHHSKNQGLGQSLIDGYEMAMKLDVDIVVVMAGDNQMSPSDLPNIVKPLEEGIADYSKGNRLLREEVFRRMPKHRLIGNSILTILTKFATGYWNILDPQSGYTAISINALRKIPITKMVKGYGYNADILHMLNLQDLKVVDVDIEPVYGQEKSKIKLKSYIPNISWLLVKLFTKRMFIKYVVNDFHPLFLLYMFSILTGTFVVIPLSIRFFYLYFSLGEAPQTTLILLTFTFTMSFYSLCFAMWMDIQDNQKLRV